MKPLQKCSITVDEFEFIRDLIYERAGLVIDYNKQYLVESRLGELIKNEGLLNYEQLVAMTRHNPTGSLSEKIIDAMTTNETYFFRDIFPFEAFKKYFVPTMLSKIGNVRPLKIWSAACSTGQEPYSLAMIIKEHFPQLLPYGVKIYASDISREAITKAREGVYGQLEVNRGLPAPMLVKHFDKIHDKWIIREDIKEMVDFFEINLKGFWPPIPCIDIIFLRNVMIYFDIKTKTEVLHKMRRVMNPEGFLVLGGAETTLMLDDSFIRNEVEKSPYYTLQPEQQLSKVVNGDFI